MNKKPLIQRASPIESPPPSKVIPSIQKDISNEKIQPPPPSTKNVIPKAPKKSRKEELQIRSENRLLLNMIKEKEILEERLKEKEKTILFQDAAIYGLSEKVAQMERGLLPESVKALTSKVSSKMISKGALDKQKKRDAKEAA